MKYLFTFSILFFFQVSFSQTILQGSVTDRKTGEPIIFGTVALYKNGRLVSGTTTNLDGSYSFEIEEGIYDIEVSYTGYGTKKKIDIHVQKNRLTKQDVELSQGTVLGCGYTIYTSPILKIDDTTQGFSFDYNEIRRLPHRGQ